MREPTIRLAPIVGVAHDEPTSSSSFVIAMAREWSEAAERLPQHAPLGSLTGLHADRVARLVNGALTSTPTEAQAIDNALGTNASRHLPKREPYVQTMPADSAFADTTWAKLTVIRAGRVASWGAKIEASGLTMPELGRRTNIGPIRLTRILLRGLTAEPCEIEAIQAALVPPKAP